MDYSIRFDNVNKSFLLQHQKTLKEFIHAIFVRNKTLEKVHALQDISFVISKGETVGIIGRNGAGKSTMLKLVAGVSAPTAGNISIHGRVAPLIELGAGFHPELTGQENIYLNGVILGLSEEFILAKIADIVAFSELERRFIDMPVKHYSSGMYMRLAFSVAIFTDPDILLVDEILAVGDSSFQKKCFKKMEEFQKKHITIVYVSHNLDQVQKFCKRALYLRGGKLVFDGDAVKAVSMYKSDTT